MTGAEVAMDLEPELLLRIKSAVTTHFLESGDFNGVLASDLPQLAAFDPKDSKLILLELCEKRQVELAFASESGNPYIKRVPSPPLEKQLTLLETEGC
jgi:hypothetical protein